MAGQKVEKLKESGMIVEWYALKVAGLTAFITWQAFKFKYRKPRILEIERVVRL